MIEFPDQLNTSSFPLFEDLLMTALPMHMRNLSSLHKLEQDVLKYAHNVLEQTIAQLEKQLETASKNNELLSNNKTKLRELLTQLPKVSVESATLDQITSNILEIKEVLRAAVNLQTLAPVKSIQDISADFEKAQAELATLKAEHPEIAESARKSLVPYLIANAKLQASSPAAVEMLAESTALIAAADISNAHIYGDLLKTDPHLNFSTAVNASVALVDTLGSLGEIAAHHNLLTTQLKAAHYDELHITPTNVQALTGLAITGLHHEFPVESRTIIPPTVDTPNVQGINPTTLEKVASTILNHSDNLAVAQRDVETLLAREEATPQAQVDARDLVAAVKAYQSPPDPDQISQTTTAHVSTLKDSSPTLTPRVPEAAVVSFATTLQSAPVADIPQLVSTFAQEQHLSPAQTQTLQNTSYTVRTTINPPLSETIRITQETINRLPENQPLSPDALPTAQLAQTAAVAAATAVMKANNGSSKTTAQVAEITQASFATNIPSSNILEQQLSSVSDLDPRVKSQVAQASTTAYHQTHFSQFTPPTPTSPTISPSAIAATAAVATVLEKTRFSDADKQSITTEVQTHFASTQNIQDVNELLKASPTLTRLAANTTNKTALREVVTASIAAATSVQKVSDPSSDTASRLGQVSGQLTHALGESNPQLQFALEAAVRVMNAPDKTNFSTALPQAGVKGPDLTKAQTAINEQYHLPVYTQAQPLVNDTNAQEVVTIFNKKGVSGLTDHFKTYGLAPQQAEAEAAKYAQLIKTLPPDQNATTAVANYAYPTYVYQPHPTATAVLPVTTTPIVAATAAITAVATAQKLSPEQIQTIQQSFVTAVNTGSFTQTGFTKTLADAGIPNQTAKQLGTSATSAYQAVIDQVALPVTFPYKDRVALASNAVANAFKQTTGAQLNQSTVNQIATIISASPDVTTAQVQIAKLPEFAAFTKAANVDLTATAASFYTNATVLSKAGSTASPTTLSVNYIAQNHNLSPQTTTVLYDLVGKNLSVAELTTKLETANLPATVTAKDLAIQIASLDRAQSAPTYISTATAQKMSTILNRSEMFADPQVRHAVVASELGKLPEFSHLSTTTLGGTAQVLIDSSTKAPLTQERLVSLVTDIANRNRPLPSIDTNQILSNLPKKYTPEQTLSFVYQNNLGLSGASASALAKASADIDSLMKHTNNSLDARRDVVKSYLQTYLSNPSDPKYTQEFKQALSQLNTISDKHWDHLTTAITRLTPNNSGAITNGDMLNTLVSNYQTLPGNMRVALERALQNPNNLSLVIAPTIGSKELTQSLIGFRSTTTAQPVNLLTQAYVLADSAARNQLYANPSLNLDTLRLKHFEAAYGMSLDHLAIHATNALSTKTGADGTNYEKLLKLISTEREKLSLMSPEQRLTYYNQLLSSLKVNAQAIINDPKSLLSLFQSSNGSPVGLLKLASDIAKNPSQMIPLLKTQFSQVENLINLSKSAGNLPQVFSTILKGDLTQFQKFFPGMNLEAQRYISIGNKFLSRTGLDKVGLKIMNSPAFQKIAQSAIGKAIGKTVTAAATKIATTLGLQAVGSAVPLIGNLIALVVGIIIDNTIGAVINGLAKAWQKYRQPIEEARNGFLLSTFGAVGGIGGAISGIASGITGAISVAVAATASGIGSIAVIILAILIGTPMVIAFFLLVITNSSYVVPASQSGFSQDPDSPFVNGAIYTGPIPPGCPEGWPVNANPVTIVQGSYAPYSHNPYEAIDITIGKGTTVIATHDGIAVARNVGDGYGNFVDVYSVCEVNGVQIPMFTRYAHLSAFVGASPSGSQVTRGTQIGRSGGAIGEPGSGNSTGPHLHYEVRLGRPTDMGSGSSIGSTQPARYDDRPPFLEPNFVPRFIPRRCTNEASCNP